MKLKDAVELFRKEERAPVNSYEWYRKQAHESGTVSIDGANVPAYKYKGSWHIDDERVDEAIKKHREAVEHLKQVTSDYDKGIIHGKNGDTISTTWGVIKSSGVSGSYGLIMKFIVMVAGIVMNVIFLLRLNTIKKNVIFVGTGMVVDAIALSAEFIALNVVNR